MVPPFPLCAFGGGWLNEGLVGTCARSCAGSSPGGLRAPPNGPTALHENTIADHAPVSVRVQMASLYRGTSLIRNQPPPQDRHRSLGMVLL